MIKTPKIIITITTKTIQNIKLPGGIKNLNFFNKRASKIQKLKLLLLLRK